jgi:acetate kinase
MRANASASAQEATDLFCFRVAGELAKLATAIGRIDAIVFTAGAGESSPLVRRLICGRLAWLGVDLDVAAKGDEHEPHRFHGFQRRHTGHSDRRGGHHRTYNTVRAVADT